MNCTRPKRAALFTLALLALLIAVPVGMIWRVVRQERLNWALVLAVKRNDDKVVVSLLRGGADANCRDEPPRKFSLWETLMQVVRGRQVQPSYSLMPLEDALEPRALPSYAHDLFGAPPENVRLVRALLDHGARLNQTDVNGETPLLLAIDDGMNATIHLLLARGANVIIRNEQGIANTTYAPLVHAVQTPYVEIGVIAELLDRGADVNERDENTGLTALYQAVYEQRVDVVRLLLARHADVTLLGVYDDKWETPMGHALLKDTPQSRQIVRLLRAAGARK